MLWNKSGLLVLEMDDIFCGQIPPTPTPPPPPYFPLVLFLYIFSVVRSQTPPFSNMQWQNALCRVYSNLLFMLLSARHILFQHTSAVIHTTIWDSQPVANHFFFFQIYPRWKPEAYSSSNRKFMRLFSLTPWPTTLTAPVYYKTHQHSQSRCHPHT